MICPRPTDPRERGLPLGPKFQTGHVKIGGEATQSHARATAIAAAPGSVRGTFQGTTISVLAQIHTIFIAITCCCFLRYRRSLQPVAPLDSAKLEVDSRQSTRGSLCARLRIPRVRFRGYSDLEICRIAGDIALIHDISTSGPPLFIHSSPSHHQLS